MLMTILLEGVVLRAGVEPPAVHRLDDDDAEWDMLGLACCMVLTAGTVNTQEARPSSVPATCLQHASSSP